MSLDLQPRSPFPIWGLVVALLLCLIPCGYFVYLSTLSSGANNPGAYALGVMLVPVIFLVQAIKNRLKK